MRYCTFYVNMSTRVYAKKMPMGLEKKALHHDAATNNNNKNLSWIISIWGDLDFDGRFGAVAMTTSSLEIMDFMLISKLVRTQRNVRVR